MFRRYEFCLDCLANVLCVEVLSVIFWKDKKYPPKYLSSDEECLLNSVSIVFIKEFVLGRVRRNTDVLIK